MCEGEKKGSYLNIEIAVDLLECPCFMLSQWSSCFSSADGSNLMQVCSVNTEAGTHLYKGCVLIHVL